MPRSERGRYALLCLAHLVNDAYLNVIPFLLPPLMAAGRLSLGEGAALSAAFLFTAFALQPVIGHFSHGERARRAFVLGPAWAAGLLALLALPLPFPALLATAALAGAGVAAFHPHASALVYRLGPAGRGRRMAVFLAAGNLGWAVAPLGLPRLVAGGLEGAAALPGAAAGLALAAAFLRPGAAGTSAPEAGRAAATAAEAAREDTASGRPAWPALVSGLSAVRLIVLIVALRSWSNFGLLTLLPAFFAQRGLDAGAAGRLVAVFTLAGVVGGLAGGALSDRWGRRRVTGASLALAAVFLAAVPAAAAAPAVPGATTVLLALGGAALLASFPVTLVAAQEVLAANPALAAGLLLGLAVGLGSLGVAAAGRLAEAWGAVPALWALAAAPLGAALLSARMPESPVSRKEGLA